MTATTEQPIRVTVTAPDTGTVREQITGDDFLVICGRDRYVASTVAFANGTTVVTIKRDAA